MRQAQAVMGPGQVGVEGCGHAVVTGGLVVLSPREGEVAEFRRERGVERVDRQGGAEDAVGLLVESAISQRRRDRAADVHAARGQLQGPLEAPEGLVEFDRGGERWRGRGPG